jgi:circadian clock protein KaiC
LSVESDLIEDHEPVPTGVPGLDEVLVGGYARGNLHLIEGQPGTGKTTLGLQFLLDGRAKGEQGLYVTLSETRRELLRAARTHGWSLDGIEIFELVPPELTLDPKKEQTLLYASDLELGETVNMVKQEVERIRPERVVFDSVSEIRMLSQGSLRYRRQILALKHFLALQNCTTLFLDDLSAALEETSLHSLVHGVVRLQQTALQFGGDRRRLQISKMRGRDYKGGFHDYVIRKGGLTVFPRLIAAEHQKDLPEGPAVTSGLPELDALLGGGLTRGASTLIMGPSGTGKSSLTLQFVSAALSRGEKVLMVSFDETRRILLTRAEGMGIDLAGPAERGELILEHIDPAELSPGEMIGMIRARVEAGAAMVVLDSLTGYQNAMPEENYLTLHMHELLSYLGQQGVVTLLVLAQHGLVGPMQTTVDLTYISDTVLLLRFFEAAGKIRRAMSVMKKRTGPHEDTIREFRIDAKGVRVGPALEEFQGVLTGVPSFSGSTSTLLETNGKNGHGG